MDHMGWSPPPLSSREIRGAGKGLRTQRRGCTFILVYSSGQSQVTWWHSATSKAGKYILLCPSEIPWPWENGRTAPGGHWAVCHSEERTFWDLSMGLSTYKAHFSDHWATIKTIRVLPEVKYFYFLKVFCWARSSEDPRVIFPALDSSKFSWDHNGSLVAQAH